MLTPQNFQDSHRYRQTYSDASSAFEYSSRTSGAPFSDDLLPATVPATPEHLANKGAHETGKSKVFLLNFGYVQTYGYTK